MFARFEMFKEEIAKTCIFGFGPHLQCGDPDYIMSGCDADLQILRILGKCSNPAERRLSSRKINMQSSQLSSSVLYTPYHEDQISFEKLRF